MTVPAQERTVTAEQAAALAAVEAQRQEQLALSAAAIATFVALWPLLLRGLATGSLAPWFAALARVGGPYAAAGWQQARARYEDDRVRAGAPGRAPAFQPVALDVERLWGSMRQLLAKATRDVAEGRAEQVATPQTQAAMAQAFQRHVLEPGRRLVSTAVDDAAALRAGEPVVEALVDRQLVGYLRTTDGDPCDFCAMLASRGAVYASPESALLREDGEKYHDGCFIGSVVVDGPSPTRAMHRWYAGKVVDLRVEGGEVVTATANHPVLTTRGWLPIEALDESSYVFDAADLDRMMLRDPDHHDDPATIAEVASALRHRPGVVTTSVPTSPEDFHGDGGHGDVDVVDARGFLRDRTVGRKTVEVDLLESVDDRSGLARRRELRLLLDGLAAPSSGVVRGSHVGPPSLWREPGLVDQPSFATSSHLCPGHTEGVRESLTVDAEVQRERLEALARLVPPKRVVQVDHREWSGHVYNLETTGGWYTANDLIVHNCGCLAVAVWSDDPVLPEINEEMRDLWYESQRNPPPGERLDQQGPRTEAGLPDVASRRSRNNFRRALAARRRANRDALRDF